jgi:hypothetical protein
MQVKVITPFKIRGEIIPLGTVLRVPAESMPKLAGRVVPIRTEPAKLICYWCHSTEFWLSIYGRTICRKCHPPALGAEVAA